MRALLTKRKPKQADAKKGFENLTRGADRGKTTAGGAAWCCAAGSAGSAPRRPEIPAMDSLPRLPDEEMRG
jgi:hypothetical protein